MIEVVSNERMFTVWVKAKDEPKKTRQFPSGSMIGDLWGIIFGVVHRLEGQVFSLVVGHKSSYASRAVTKVEWRVIYSIDDGESWRQGAAGSRRWIPGARRRQALFGVVVALTTEGSRKISALIDPEDGTAEEGGGGFYRVHMRCTLRVC